MAKPLVPDELWELIRPLLPAPKLAPVPIPSGRKPIGDRDALTGILFAVLKTGIPWETLSAEMGCGCGMSCWREAPGLADGRGVARPAPTAPDPARQRRGDRLVPSGRRCHLRSGVRRGRGEWANPTDRGRFGR